MSKLNLKVDLSAPKGVELFFMGISSSAGVAIMADQINRFIDIDLRFYQQMIALQQDTILDSLPIFTNFEPQKNEVQVEEELDFFDLRLSKEKETTKFLLIQTKGEKANLFPKITPLDFILISNYSIIKFESVIQSIHEVTIQFELKKEHLGKRYDYFRNLFYN